MRGKRLPVAVLFCLVTTLASMSVSAGEPVGKDRRDSVEPLVDLLAVTASCSALVLPQARTESERLQNAGARQAYIELRRGLKTQINSCAATGPAAPSNTVEEALKIGVTVCGDCPDCLSAASCSGCVAGAVCSAPGASPTRACRVLQTCGYYWNGNIRACCGCS